MHHLLRWYRQVARLLLIALIVGWLPTASSSAAAFTSPQGAVDAPADPPPDALTVAPIADPHLPSLTLRLALDPDPLAIGDTAALSVTVTNSAPDPAENLVVTLPTPDGALALSGPTTLNPVQGWQWNVPHLDGHSSTTLAGTLRLVRRPAGDALLLHAQATASGLDLPIHELSGALVIDRTLGPATVPFIPGVAARLHSADGRVDVQFPAHAFARALTLRYGRTPLTDAIPPDDARYTRGLGAFFLDATDDAGVAVHQFSQPVTITIGYTPEQLQARGIAESDLTLTFFNPTTQTWQTIPTTVDPAAQTATAVVDHFTPFELGDGSSASDAFIPSVQGFQVSTFTGAASYAYPIDLPAGPAGLKPSLSLSYSSAATDGASGERVKQQASWVGKGWSLDSGSVARNKLPNGDATYALILDGQSYTLVRGAALPGSPYDTSHILGWDWTTTDDAFLRVRATSDDSWAVWTKDGTRFDFTTIAKWGWGVSGQPTFESYKWLLTTVTDTHGNTINYTYNRLQAGGAFGPVDVDVWPNTISWAGGHYQVNLISSARANDTQFEGAPNQYAAAPHETRRLDAVQVWSNPAGSWQLVRQYNLGHDYSLLSDVLTGTGCPVGQAKCGDPTYPKLTLTSLQRVGNDGTSALPATTFSYGAFSYADANGRSWVSGAWNRLTTVNNGQGGVVTLAYANVGQLANSPLMENNRRVTTRTLSDGRGNSYPWTYSYGTPNVNSLGTTRGAQSPWSYGDYGTQAYPNSAALYYNAFTDATHDSQDWLASKPMREFRGHDWVLETDPNGAQIKHWFRQGEASDKCTPIVTGAGIINDGCFQRLRDGEFLKGKEYQTKVFAAGVNVNSANPLQESDHAFVVAVFSYTSTPLTGLWRAFTAESQTDAKQYEGTGTPLVKTTKTFYNPNCTPDTTATVGYGNVGCIQEYSGASLVRTTKRYYAANALDSWTWRDANNNLLDPPPSSVQYLVDRLWQDASYDGSGGLLSLTHQFYDALPNGTTSGPSVGTEGELRLVRKYFDVPLSCCTNITLHGTDTRTDYDSFGNPTVAMTYAGASTYLNGVYSTPGAGSAARTTTTTYDSVFHALPTQVTNPLNQIERADYDDRMGTLLRVTGPNTTGTTTDCSQTNYAIPSTNSYSIPASEQSSCAQYDLFGRMVKLIKPGDSTSFPTLQATYRDTEQPFRYRIDRRETVGSANTRIEQQFYDGLGRKIQTKAESSLNAQNIVVDTRYDGLNQISALSQPHYLSENSTTFYQYTVPGGSLVNQTTTTYDALGRPIRVTTPDGKWSEHQYGITGALSYHDLVDPNRHRVQTRSDALGRLVNVYEISGDCGTSSYSWASCTAPYTTAWATYATTTYAYSPLDLLTSATDTAGNLTTLSYDSLGRKLTMSDPDMGDWSYSYDANSNLLTQTDAKSQVLWFGYDYLS